MLPVYIGAVALVVGMVAGFAYGIRIGRQRGADGIVDEMMAAHADHVDRGWPALASCGHQLHERGFGCTHKGCGNDSRQFGRPS